jgi:hypothetical protein
VPGVARALLIAAALPIGCAHVAPPRPSFVARPLAAMTAHRSAVLRVECGRPGRPTGSTTIRWRRGEALEIRMGERLRMVIVPAATYLSFVEAARCYALPDSEVVHLHDAVLRGFPHTPEQRRSVLEQLGYAGMPVEGDARFDLEQADDVFEGAVADRYRIELQRGPNALAGRAWIERRSGLLRGLDATGPADSHCTLRLISVDEAVSIEPPAGCEPLPPPTAPPPPQQATPEDSGGWRAYPPLR